MLQTTVKDTNKIEYVAVYCRTAHLDDMTIESQKSRLLNAAIQNGFSTEQILFFIDNGYSGLNLKRPGVKDLLNKLRELTKVVSLEVSMLLVSLSTRCRLLGQKSILSRQATSMILK